MSDESIVINPGTNVVLPFRNNLQVLASRAATNQIRGINTSGSTGSGIPKQVTNVAANVANASTGSTSTVTVMFQQDPTDKNFAGVNIYVKGYQANSSPVQVSSGSSSPVTFVLNNTGESVSLIVQAYGNGGNAALTSSPTTGIRLPKSTSGGFGTTTVTSGSPVSGSAVAGQLAKFASPPTTLTGANLSQDVTTSNATAATVVGIQTIPVTNSAPMDGDILRYSVTDAQYMRDFAWDFMVWPLPASNAASLLPWLYNLGPGGTAYSQTITPTAVSGTATELVANKLACAASNPSSNAILPGNNPANFGWGILRRVRFRIALGQTTTSRIWIGLISTASGSEPTFRSDTPTTNFIGFRYSTPAGDTKYQCITQISGSQTKNAETTASHVDTNIHNFEIVWNTTTVTFYIDGVQVGQQNGNLPATSVAMLPAVLLDNAATTNTVFFNWYYIKGTLALK